MLARYHSNICWVQMSAVCSPDICLETLTLAKYICQAVSTRPCVSSMLTLPGAVEFVQEKAAWESVYTLDFSHFSLFKSWLLSTHIEGDKHHWYWSEFVDKNCVFLSVRLCPQRRALFLPNFVTASSHSLSFSSPSHCHEISHTIVTSAFFNPTFVVRVGFSSLRETSFSVLLTSLVRPGHQELKSVERSEKPIGWSSWLPFWDSSHMLPHRRLHCLEMHPFCQKLTQL